VERAFPDLGFCKATCEFTPAKNHFLVATAQEVLLTSPTWGLTSKLTWRLRNIPAPVVRRPSVGWVFWTSTQIADALDFKWETRNASKLCSDFPVVSFEHNCFRLFLCHVII
jgi:hypothetical protein